MKVTCVKCGIEKFDTEFNKDSSKKNNLHSWCKECSRELSKKHYHEHKEERREKDKEYSRKYGKTLNGRFSKYKHSAKERNLEFGLT